MRKGKSSKAPLKSAAKSAAKPLRTNVAAKSAASAKPVKANSTKGGKAVALQLSGSAKRVAPSKRPAASKPEGKAKAERPVGKKSEPSPPAVVKKLEGKKGTMAARTKPAPITLEPNYRPSEDEPFMNERQRLYFRQRLLTWKDEILEQTRETLTVLHEDSAQHADLADRATSETDRALELRARDRQRKLISKIDAALARIEDGSYGYCEETGEPIGLKRLDARPIATLSLEAQERHERRERVYRED